MLRSLARPLLAATFIVDGVDAVVRPQAHVGALADVETPLKRATASWPWLPHKPATLVRIAGAVSVVAGASLAVGKAPRLAATTLAVVNTPLIVAAHPFWSASGEERREHLRGAGKGAALLGGLLLASADTAGKPSIAWRASAYKDHQAQIARIRADALGKQLSTDAGRLGGDARHVIDDVTKSAKRAARSTSKAAKRASRDAKRTARRTVREAKRAVAA